MSYCTQQNLLDRFREAELIQLTNPETPTAVAIDAIVLNKAIDDATADINSYLVAYLPLSAIPANLERVACDITRYYLYADQVTEQVEKRYKQAIEYLVKVAAGKIPLAPDTAGQVDAPSEATVEFSSSPSVFSRD